MNPKHLSLSNEHFTPPNVLVASLAAIGHDFEVNQLLDPASCELANSIIQADKYLSQQEDGLMHDWYTSTVFCNPPGGVTKGESTLAVWARKFSEEYKRDRFERGAFLCFNTEVLNRVPELWDDAMVVLLQKRIHFLGERREGELVPGQWSKFLPDLNLEHRINNEISFTTELGWYVVELPGEKFYARWNSLGAPARYYQWISKPSHASAIVLKGVPYVDRVNVHSEFQEVGLDCIVAISQPSHDM